MTLQTRWALLIFLTPIFFGLIYTTYYQANRHNVMQRLAESGVVALYDGGMVTQEDLQWYFENPPIKDSPLLRALELTPEDVSGLNHEDPAWLQSQSGQLLINRIIQHLAMIQYLNSRWSAYDMDNDQAEITAYREQLMRTYMEKDLAQITPEITQEEMLDYYIKHPESFHREGKRLARHLMIENVRSSDPKDPFLTTPDMIIKRLKNGEDFLHLIHQESRSMSSSNNGLLGWHTRGTFHENFDRVLWSLEIGEVTGPIRADDTLHFIQLLDEQEEGLIPYNKCKSDIRTILTEEKRKIRRFKLLGLSKDLLSNDDPAATEEYKKALLQAAYAREWDKNVAVVEKTDAFSQYHKADLLFRIYMNQYRDTLNLTRETEGTLNLQNQCAKYLLDSINFRFLVKLNTSPPS